MKKLLILTKAFPYTGEESFIEAEAPHWKSLNFDVYLASIVTAGEKRNVPNNVNVLEECDSIFRSKLLEMVFYLIRALFSRTVYSEVSSFLKLKKSKLTASVFLEIVKQCAAFEKEKVRVGKVIKLTGNIDVAYCYWNHLTCYAACFWKQKGKIRKVVSRAHGFDVYEDRRKGNYLPLKRAFKSEMDKVYLISEKMTPYFIENYGFEQSQLAVSRLGVCCKNNQVLAGKSQSSSEIRIRALSISSCIEIKRLDIIFEGLRMFALENSGVQVDWYHVGDGPLLSGLKDTVNARKPDNFSFFSLGYMSNNKVLEFLSQEFFDVIVNASRSEGVPVSIMEAMSFGVPGVAPDVGAVSELVGNDTGYLMPALSTSKDICNGVAAVLHDSERRVESGARIRFKFDANKNYRNFVAGLNRIC